jgi:hypothetical protein
MTDLFIAYEFPDPWASRMLDADTSLVALVERLRSKRVTVTTYGPAIYRSPAGADPMLAGVPVCLWRGGDVVCQVGGDHHGASEQPLDHHDGLMSSVSHFVLGLEEEDGEVQGLRGRDPMGEDGADPEVDAG